MWEKNGRGRYSSKKSKSHRLLSGSGLNSSGKTSKGRPIAPRRNFWVGPDPPPHYFPSSIVIRRPNKSPRPAPGTKRP